MCSAVMPINDYYKKISTGYSGLSSNEISILGDGKRFPALDFIDPSDLINHNSSSTNSQNEDVTNKENIDLEKTETPAIEKTETPAITPINDYYRKILDEHSEIQKGKTSDFDVHAFYEALSIESLKGNDNDNNNTVTSFSSYGVPDVGYSMLFMGPLPTPVVSEHNINGEPLSMADPCPCNVCGIVFSNNVDLIEHLYTHLSDEDRCPYPCNICGKEYKAKHNLKRHLKKVHNVAEDLIFRYLEDANQNDPASKSISEGMVKRTGKIVNEVLGFKENSQRPSESLFDMLSRPAVGPMHPPTNNAPVDDYNPYLAYQNYDVGGATNNCHICRRVLSDKLALKNHMLTQHGIDIVSENYFACPFCHEKLENSEIALRSHLHQVHQVVLHEHISMVEDDPLKNPLGNSVISPVVSTAAVSQQDGEKDIRNNVVEHCQVTDQVNNTSSSTNNGYNTTPNNNNSKLSHDDNNNNNSNNSNVSNSNSSVDNNSTDSKPKSSSKSFSCVICEKSFSWKWSLKRHMHKVHKITENAHQMSSLHIKDKVEKQTEEKEQSTKVPCDPFRPKCLICHICQKQLLCTGISDMDMYMELRAHIHECHPDTAGNDSLTDTISPYSEFDAHILSAGVHANVEDNAISMLDIHL